MTRPLRIVVAGAGHLGTYHLQKVALHPKLELVAVVEPSLERAAKAKAAYGVPVLSTMAALESAAVRYDALICATPTQHHVAVAVAALARGAHVLVEKPLAPTAEQGRLLVRAQQRTGRILQVGHCERFSPAMAAALPLAHGARFIVAERLGPFSGRSTDVDVVLDLMIHDIDLCLRVMNDEVVEVRAIGVPILTEACDMASVRLAFRRGSVAQLSAGRASLTASRKMRFFTPTRYLSVDCQMQSVRSVIRGPSGEIDMEEVALGPGDALSRQLDSFVSAIEEGRQPEVDATSGLRALEVAEEIKRAIAVQEALLQSECKMPSLHVPHRGMQDAQLETRRA